MLLRRRRLKHAARATTDGTARERIIRDESACADDMTTTERDRLENRIRDKEKRKAGKKKKKARMPEIDMQQRQFTASTGDERTLLTSSCPI